MYTCRQAIQEVVLRQDSNTGHCLTFLLYTLYAYDVVPTQHTATWLIAKIVVPPCNL